MWKFDRWGFKTGKKTGKIPECFLGDKKKINFNRKFTESANVLW